MAADILLSFGVATSDADVSEIQKGLQTIIKKIEKDPPQVRVGLTVDDDALKGFKTKLEGVLKTLSLANGAPITLKIDGLGEVTSEAAKATKALKDVEVAAENAADDAQAAFKDATRAVREYYAALTKLAKQKTDIFLDGSEYRSASGNYAELAKELNRTKTAFDAVEKARSSMDSEHQVRLQTQMTQEATKYNRILEEQANKERIAAEAAKARADAEQAKASASREKADAAEEARKEADAFKDATRAVKEYYAVRSKLAKSGDGSKDDIYFYGTEYRSISGNHSELAKELTRTKIAYDAVAVSKSKLSDESLNRLTALEAQELRSYNLVVEEQANKERKAAEAAHEAAEKIRLRNEAVLSSAATAHAQIQKLDVLINQNEANLRKWTSAKNGATSSDYQAIQDEVEEWKRMRSEISSTGDAIRDFDSRIGESTLRVDRHSTAIKDAGKNTKSLGDHFGSLAGKFASWLTISQSIMFAVRTLKKMITTVIELDSAMTELRKVTDETDASYERFLTNASKRARELGASLADVVSATADFARLGHSVDIASELADAALVYKNVGDGVEDITQATESIVSTMQAFQIDPSNVMRVVDVFNSVGNKFAISSGGVGDAMQRSAAAMYSAGNTLEETAALVAAANTVLQNPDVVGTTLKTVSMFLRASKVELEEAGESADGMANSVSELREKLLALTEGQVDILTDAGNYKSTYQILKEISGVWDGIVSNQGTDSAAILELLGGKRNANAVAAILENFDIAERALSVASDSAGSAMIENQKHLDSITGKISKFQSAWERLSATVVNSELVKIVVDFGTALLDAANWIAEFLGSIGALCIAIPAAVAAFEKFKVVRDLFNGIAAIGTNLAGVFSNIAKVAVLFVRNISSGVGPIRAFSDAVNSLGISLSAAGKAALVAVAVFAALKLLDKLIVTTDEAIEKHDELASKYRETAAEFKTLSDELLEVQNRLKELNEIDEPSMVNPEELEKLKATEESLLRQIKYKEKLKDYEQGQAADAAYAALTNDPVFGDDMLTKVRNLQSELETLKQLGANAYDRIATLTPGSARFNSTEAEIKKFASEIESIEADIASSMLELDSLYSSLVDDQGNAIRADHGNMVAELKILLELDDESAEQAAQDAGDVAGQVSNTISGAIKEAFSAEAQEELDKNVNGFQSTLSALSSALSDLQKGELGASDVVDLMQEFPALAPYIDITADGFGNLEEGLRNLIKASPDSVIGTLQGFKETYELTEDQTLMIDALCGAFQMMTSEALESGNAIDKVNKVIDGANSDIDDFQSSINTLSDALTKLQDGELGVADVVDLLQEFPALASYIDITAENFGNLENGLKSLISSSPDGLIKTLQEMRDTAGLTEEQRKQIDLLCDAVQKLSAEMTDGGVEGAIADYASAIGNFENVADKIASVSDSLQTVADLQDEVANGFTMSLDKALEFAAVYPEILNGATVSADGQISLNEDVVNSFISGKEAEMKSQIDEQIAALEADKATLVAKKEFAEAQLKLAQSVGEGEGQISEDVAEYRVRAGNAVAEALVNAGVQEADAYRLACAAMAGNAEEFNSIAAAVCTDVQGNFNSAAYAAAQAIYRNMNRAKTDIASLASQAQDAARAIAGMSKGSVAGSSSVRGGSGGGVYSGGGRITQRKWQFDGVDFQYDPVLFELEDFISQLELDISEYEDAIAQIDGQIAVLKALRERDLGSYKSDRTSGSGGGGSGGGSSGGNSDADNAIADAEDALRDEFKDYLNDMEHLISLMERNNVPDAEIIDAYKRMMEAIHAEAERARANGEDENSDYVQELQDQWWEYHDAIQEIRDDITEGAKSAVEELVDYRIDMLKQELEDEKDALDERLDQLKEFYDEQKEMLREQYDEEKYLEEQAEKRKAVSDIEAELEGLKYDDSAWAQKRRAELEAELADARKELEDFEEENALSEVEKLLDEQYEKQAALIQAQIDAIEEKLNDPNALYNQALNDIKNSTEALYQEMVAYNNAHGDGNAETIRAFWEECFAALKDYEDLFGEAFEGVNMDNATGYGPGHGSVDIGDSSSTPASGGDTGSTKPDTGYSGSTPASVAPALEKGSRVQVKDGVKWYADSNGGGKWGYAKSGTIKYVNKEGSHPYNIDGAGWVRKKDIVGYASGTANATPGLHQIYENGEEFIFESPSDGSKYRIFRGGEKVLDAKATNFLYNFANTQGGTLKDRWSSLVNSVMQRFAIGSGNGTTIPQIVMGDIIVQGNASDRTLSEIRRAQREHTAELLKELKKLSRG